MTGPGEVARSGGAQSVDWQRAVNTQVHMTAINPDAAVKVTLRHQPPARSSYGIPSGMYSVSTSTERVGSVRFSPPFSAFPAFLLPFFAPLFSLVCPG